MLPQNIRTCLTEKFLENYGKYVIRNFQSQKQRYLCYQGNVPFFLLFICTENIRFYYITLHAE